MSTILSAINFKETFFLGHDASLETTKMAQLSSTKYSYNIVKDKPKYQQHGIQACY